MDHIKKIAGLLTDDPDIIAEDDIEAAREAGRRNIARAGGRPQMRAARPELLQLMQRLQLQDSGRNRQLAMRYVTAIATQVDYAADLPPVLHQLGIEVPPGEDPEDFYEDVFDLATTVYSAGGIGGV